MLSLAMAFALMIDPPFQEGLDRAPVSRGSVIRGLPEDTVLPVEVLGREQLQERGAPNVAELLGRYGEGFVVRPRGDGVIGLNACTRVDTQYVELPKDEADARYRAPLTQAPDADLIRAVLRSVDGRCEIVVIREQVSRPVNGQAGTGNATSLRTPTGSIPSSD